MPPSTERRRPTSSVVIAAYNCAPTIGQALDSVLAQSFEDFEVIVVDDGSTDATSDVVQGYLADPRVRLRRQRNQGPAAARNAGIELTCGRYVSMLDSDDLWLPRYLESMIQTLERDPAAGFAFTRAWILERATNRIRKQCWPSDPPAPESAEDLLEALIERNFIFNSVTVRHDALLAVGSYNPTLFAAEDYDLWLRLATHGYAGRYVPGPLCVGSDRPGSLSHCASRMLEGRRSAYESLLRNEPLPARLAAPVKRQLAKTDAELELLAESAHVRPLARSRRIIADATRPWRTRQARRKQPPAEVVKALHGVGAGLPRKPAGPPSPPASAHENGTERTSASSIPALSRLVVRGAGIAGAGYVITQLISFATYLALARLLDPADLGTFAAAGVLATVGLVVGESGLLAALIRRSDRLEEAFNSAFLASIAGGLLLTLLAVAAAPVIGLIFHSFRVGVMSAVLGGSMLLRLAVIVPNAMLQRNFSFMRRTLLDPLGTLLFAAGAVAGSVAGLGAWSLVIGTYAQFSVDLVVSWAMVRWRPRPRLASRAMWRELVRFGRPVCGANAISHGTAQVPIVAVGRVLGASALGQLSYAIRVGTQPFAAIVDVAAYSLLPAFARIANDAQRLRAGLLRTLRWACAISFPLGLLLVPLGNPAIVLVFGARWRPAGEAVMAMGVYCAALTFDSVASEAWKAAGRPGMLPRMHGLNFALTVVFVAAAVPFGLVPVTAALAAAAIVVAAYAVHGMSTVVGISSRSVVVEVWPPAVAASLMAGVLLVTEHLLRADRYPLPAGIALLAAQALLGLVLYLSCLLALSPHCRRVVSQAAARRRWKGMPRASQERLSVSPTSRGPGFARRSEDPVERLLREQDRVLCAKPGSARSEASASQIDGAPGLDVSAAHGDHVGV